MRCVARYVRMPALRIALLFVAAAQVQPQQLQRQGTVHIYRPRLTVRTAAHPTVSCDDFAVVRMQNGRVYTMSVSAGRHTFSTTSNSTGIKVDVEAGKEYFVRIDLESETRAIPSLVDAAQGRMETMKMRPLDGRYIEAATCGTP